MIVWRFTGRRLLSLAAEKRAQVVATQFFILAPYIAFEAVQHLAAADRTDVSVLGMILTATSLVGMPFLGIAKQHLAVTLGSSATHGEGSQNLICAYLAGAVFLGLAGNALLGWWWPDPLAARLSPAPRSRKASKPGAERDAALLPTLFRRRSAKTTAATEVPDLRLRLAAARHRAAHRVARPRAIPHCSAVRILLRRQARHCNAPPGTPCAAVWDPRVSDSSTRSCARPYLSAKVVARATTWNSSPLALPGHRAWLYAWLFWPEWERAPKPLAAARRPEV